MRKTIIKTFVFISILIFSSCATIISGSKQYVEISSEPSSAKVYINEIEIGKTPVQKNLKRNRDYQLTIKLDGFKTYETKLEKKFNVWFIGNALIGGGIGIVVDVVTGAMFKLKPEEIDGNLKGGTTFKIQNENLFIMINMESDPNWEKIGQLEKSE